MSIPDLSIAATRRERRGIIVALLLLILLILITLRWAIPHEQADLEGRSLHALRQAGIDTETIGIDVSGRDAVLHVENLDPAQTESARLAVEQVYGVRRVTIAAHPEAFPGRKLAAALDVGEANNEGQPETVPDATSPPGMAEPPYLPAPVPTPEVIADQNVKVDAEAPGLAVAGPPAVADASTADASTPALELPSTASEKADTTPSSARDSDAVPTSTPIPESTEAVTGTPLPSERSSSLFSPGSSLLTEAGYRELEEVARSLRADPRAVRRIRIDTIDTGNPYFNAMLSRRRADIVVMTMLRRGVSPSRIVIQSQLTRKPEDLASLKAQ